LHTPVFGKGQGFMSNPKPTEKERKMKNIGEIRIYVACLASYNNGTLHGEWIDATQGEDGIWRDVSQMLLKSPAEYAEEWAIHDYEGFEGINLSEYASFETVAEYAAFIEEHGKLGGKLIAYYGDLDDARDAISDHYAGEYDSLSDYAEQLTEETTQIPEALRYYIDYEAMARDLEINDVLAIEDGRSVHVFWRA
jgi:antirestriction protein